MSGDIQISPHVGELFVKYGVRRQYRSGEVLLEKGALSAQAGFLVKGQLRTFCLGPSGDEISLFYLGPGNLFGSSALVYHAKVMVSVSAISPAEVYLLAADRFWKLWQEHGYPPQDLMAHFVRRISSSAMTSGWPISCTPAAPAPVPPFRTPTSRSRPSPV